MAGFCASCGSELTPDARFCASCGAPTTPSCTSCGSELPHGAAFCPSCGAAQAEPTVELKANEELRVISAMFIDLAGFTSHTERSDPEDVRQRLSVFHRKVREDVARFGGSVEKLMGDGVFAVWGVPTAFEDDPERAVRTGLRILQSIEEANASNDELELTVRIGIATGQAIVQMDDTSDEERIVGDVVNTASRLEGVAAPGTVVIDERTYIAVRSSVECTPLDPVEVKGKAGALPIWRADEAKSRFGVAVDQDESTEFVGRAEELSLLLEAFERTIARRSPQLVTIVGEPGVGKSRLVRELFDRIDDRPDLTRWRQGRNLPYGEGITFWALSEVVKSEAGILESEPAERAKAKLSSAVAALTEGTSHVDGPWLEDRLGLLAGVGSPSSATQGELFSAWLQFFELMARSTPLVLVIEDLHWADESLADFLEHLLDWAEDAPILVIATTRPEWYERRPSWGGGKREGVTINLATLSSDETGALVQVLAQSSAIPQSVQDVLMDRSGGNPLYVTEYVRLAAEQGWFDGGVDLDDVPLPDSVQSIIASRIDLLDDEGRSTIHAAAVVGRVFWTGALTYVRGADDAMVRDKLLQLSQRELVQPVRRSSMEGQDEFTFAHVLARDVAYGQLTRSERARLHRETARWLEAVSAGREVDVAELLAYHHETALSLEPSSDPELLGRVHRFLLLAGERTRSLDISRSIDFYRRAAELAPRPVDRAHALLRRGETPTGSPDEAIEALTEAAELFAGAGDRVRQAEALSSRSSIHWWGGNMVASEEDANVAMELIADAEPSESVGKVLLSKALLDQLAGRVDVALDVVEQALEVARVVGDTKRFAGGLRAKGAAMLMLGDITGQEMAEESLRIHLDRGDTAEAIAAYNNVATHYGDTGDVRKAVDLISEAIEYGRQRGAGPQVEWSIMTKNESLFRMGLLDEFEQAAKDLIAADEARGGSQTGHFAEAFALYARWLRGEQGELWDEVRAIHERSEELGDPQVIVPSVASTIQIATDLGHLDEAGYYLDQMVELGDQQPAHLSIHLPMAINGYIAAGRVHDLQRLVASARSVITRGFSWISQTLDWADAMIAADAGDPAGALATLLPIIEEGDRRELMYVATRIRIDAARCAIDAGDMAMALELLDRVSEDATEMGAVLLLAQANDLRSQATSS